MWLKRKKVSYAKASHRTPQTLDPLDFLAPQGRGSNTRDVFPQLHAVVHASLEEVEKAFQLIVEQLNPDGNIGDRLILEANGEIRNEIAKANSIADRKRDDLLAQIRVRLANLYIQGLIQAPYQEPAVKKWERLLARVERELPSISEYSFTDLAVPADRRKRLARWTRETDEWLETLCQNHVAEIMKGMVEEVGEYMASWVEVSGALRRRASIGGKLFQEVIDPEVWNFESEDPTVQNLLNGKEAQDIAVRVLDRLQLSNRDNAEVAEAVRVSLEGHPVYGTDRVGIDELESLLAVAVAEKIRDHVAIETGFLSLISNSLRIGEDLGELLDGMRRGAAAMEEKLWRVGEVGVGHVDSASGVGITESHVHDIVLRGLGGGRKFAAVEGHPADNHRFDVHMSIVGAPASDLTSFREMVGAWYAWHFEENRGASTTEAEWLKIVKADCWKLYPDIGVNTGVRNAIIELIDDDLKSLWRVHEWISTARVPNGLPSDQKLLSGLWKELGIPTKPAAAG